MDERWHEIKAIWKQHQSLYILAGFIAGLLAEPFVKALATDVLGFLQSLVPEAIGIVFTVLIIDSLYRRRAEQQLKAQLIREMSGSDNGIARRAVRELRENLALQDGSLKNAFLPFANLKKGDLMWANLESTRLDGANLQNAYLDYAHLLKASLQMANLQGADLICTNLPYANLSGANLRRARLDNAELAYAIITDAKFDKDTILPDGTHWTPDTDIGRFTDLQHPDFWRSDDPASPAYRNKEE